LLVVIVVVSLLLYSYRIRSERNRLRYNNAMLDNFFKEEQLKREQAEQERDRLRETNTMKQLKQKQEDERIFAIRESDVYQKLLHSVKAIHADDQREIRNLLNQLYPEFFARLQTLGVSKPQEILVSMLLKMGYIPSQIAVLSAHSVSSITNTRKNLYKKVTGEDGKAEDWDQIINNL
jgi:regulatory protein YycH of two-component signal transduction system YycFG